LATIPYFLSLKEVFKHILIFNLEKVGYFTWIIIPEGGGRTYGSTGSAVNA
jgi:hypothetical protein